MKIEKVKIGLVKINPENPRSISESKFNKLVQSIKEFPQMLEIRPIVVNSDMMVLGGNMRLKACEEAGLKEVFIIKASDLTPEQQTEFLIKDNVGFGEWDFDLLANNFDTEELEKWGLDLPNIQGITDEESEPASKNQWFLNVEFENEEKCQKWYEKLIEEGLICKIVQ